MSDEANVHHSSKTVEHYTPIEIIEAARETMGGIDLDPASTLSVNTHRVKAETYYGKKDGALSRHWSGRVFLNPPGGLDIATRKSNAAVWWAKLAEEYDAGRVTQAIFVGFTLEILATSQDACIWLGDFPLCFPRARIAFWTETAPGEFKRGGSPAHSNVIGYLHPAFEVDAQGERPGVMRFKRAFRGMGRVRL